MGTSGTFTGEYWPQDVPFIGEAGSSYQINLEDNIWNFSSADAAMSQKVYGNLLGQCSQYAETDGYYYCQAALTITTTLPFEILMNTTTGILTSGAHSGSSYVEFGIWVYHSGTLVGGEWYDEVAFKGTASSDPYLYVGGMNPYGLYNDAETILGGPGGGSTVKISSVAGSITESCIALGTSTLTGIPHAYSSGSDTAETVSHVKLSSMVTGVGTAQSGADDNKKLW